MGYQQTVRHCTICIYLLFINIVLYLYIYIYIHVYIVVHIHCCALHTAVSCWLFFHSCFMVKHYSWYFVSVTPQWLTLHDNSGLLYIVIILPLPHFFTNAWRNDICLILGDWANTYLVNVSWAIILHLFVYSIVIHAAINSSEAKMNIYEWDK